MAFKKSAISRKSKSIKKKRAPKKVTESKESPWHVYLLECRDKTFYCGIASNLQRRIKQHNGSPKGAKYTSTRRPVRLVWHTDVLNRSIASKEEIRIKRLSRAQKKALIKNYAPVQ